ncbi:kunitz-type serine protease inhibitor homolog beta-bungarotoxin BF B1 chain [Drosophila eugracilis]|uniref:kunitz-type serine protease inhibitor homolog beta-bungarotoxin BF B1 chain n=1 Tax=Drosophila eugracilis TaxID=29029 RepID=UPI0007E7C6C4|nr:kunitz-type serine protease inhibitor homolog beta-bungarotoxin BF B1 chain [Drosophila eugracilis]
MKFLLKLSIALFLISLVHCERDPICNEIPIVEGNCERLVRGFKYTPQKGACTRQVLHGCSVTGNFFKTRVECQDKCLDDPWTNWTQQANRIMSQIQDFFTGLFRFWPGSE